MSTNVEGHYWESLVGYGDGGGGPDERDGEHALPIRTCEHAGRLHLGTVLKVFAYSYHDGKGFHGYSHGEALGYAKDHVGFCFGADEPCGYLDRVMKQAGYEIDLYPLR